MKLEYLHLDVVMMMIMMMIYLSVPKRKLFFTDRTTDNIRQQQQIEQRMYKNDNKKLYMVMIVWLSARLGGPVVQGSGFSQNEPSCILWFCTCILRVVG